jgi:ring-1,2-phenylacetyl-CoA epoxidase subunit PaaC
MNEVDALLIKEGIAVDLSTIKPLWDATVNEVLERATLQRPENGYMHSGRLNALHTEYLGHMLGDMQFMQRAYPGLEW